MPCHTTKIRTARRMAKCKTPTNYPRRADCSANPHQLRHQERGRRTDVLKQIFGPIFESMLKGEMENHLGHKKHERSEDGDNVRNGYSSKTPAPLWARVLSASLDRQYTFEPQIITYPARRFVHRGQGTGDVCLWHEPTRHRCKPSKTSTARCHTTDSTITGCVMEEVEAWRNRPPSRSIHLLRRLGLAGRCARSTASSRWPPMSCLPHDVNGCKMSRPWINETENMLAWMQRSRRAAGPRR